MRGENRKFDQILNFGASVQRLTDNGQIWQRE